VSWSTSSKRGNRKKKNGPMVHLDADPSLNSCSNISTTGKAWILLHIPLQTGIYRRFLIAMITGEVSLTTGSAGLSPGNSLRSGKLESAGDRRQKGGPPQFPDVPTTGGKGGGFGYIEILDLVRRLSRHRIRPRQIVDKISRVICEPSSPRSGFRRTPDCIQGSTDRCEARPTNSPVVVKNENRIAQGGDRRHWVSLRNRPALLGEPGPPTRRTSAHETSRHPGLGRAPQERMDDPRRFSARAALGQRMPSRRFLSGAVAARERNGAG